MQIHVHKHEHIGTCWYTIGRKPLKYVLTAGNKVVVIAHHPLRYEFAYLQTR